MVSIPWIQGVAIVDALTLDNAALLPSRSMLLLQTYNRQVCSDLKLTLMDSYPDDTQVCLIKAAGVSGQERISWLPLYQLDRQSWVDHLTSVYVPAVGEEQSCLTPLDPLTEIMSQLRSDNGCPWDKEQNHRSLRRYVIEEAYEVADAIDLGDMNKLCEELGDLLLQVVFHAHIAEENRQFDMNDVIKEIVAKMIRRHPHVFDNIEVHDAGEVIHNWEEIKAKEREGLGDTGIINVPMAMPSLMLAEKVQSQVSRVGFDWDKPQEALKKVTEEVNELLAVIETGNMARIREEMGDMLFAAVNVSRLLKLEPEEVLKEAVGKFIRRFRYMEQEVKQQNVSMRALSLDQLEELWQKSKQEIG